MYLLSIDKNFIRNDSGAAAVEFVLIAPILLFLLIGMVDFGLYINANMKTENLARSAAEYVVKGGNPDNVMDDVVTSSQVMSEAEIDASTIDSGYTCECSDGSETECSAGCDDNGYMRKYYAFSISRPYTTQFPYPGVPETMTLTGHARLQIE